MPGSTTHATDQAAIVASAEACLVDATTRNGAVRLRAQSSLLGSLGRSLLLFGLLIGAAGEARAQRPPPQVENILSFRDWEGSWDLEWEYQGKWYGKVLQLDATQSGITGDYVLAVLKGRFVQGDIAKVSGEFTNVTNTGSPCSSGKQGGFFSLTLAKDGRSMEGWWDVCGEGSKRVWKATKR